MIGRRAGGAKTWQDAIGMMMFVVGSGVMILGMMKDEDLDGIEGKGGY